MKPGLKRAVCGLVSVGVLAVVLLSVDRKELLQTLKGTQLGWFAVAMLFFIPQKAVQAVRWRRMARSFCPVGFVESARLILAGDALNLVLPSKMGDLSKALFLRNQGRLPLPHGLNLVVFEKMFDMAALCLLLVVGVVAIRLFSPLGLVSLAGALGIIGITIGVCVLPFPAPGKWSERLDRQGTSGFKGKVARILLGASEVVYDLAGRGTSIAWIAALSIAIWVLHLLQIYCFFLALRVPVPFFQAIALVPVAIFIGLLPISVAGIGTRDAALVLLFSPDQSAAAIAGVALMTHLRYLVPGLAGLPFFQGYLGEIRLWQAAGSTEHKPSDGTGAARDGRPGKSIAAGDSE